MKKVGIVSCYFKNNYGSMLQAYASQKILDNNSIPNETINICELSDFSRGKKKYYLSQITNYRFIKTKLGMIKLRGYSKLNKSLKRNFFIRNRKFEEFKRNFNLTKSFYTYKELKEYSSKRYSDVIVGSDQLWLPVNVASDYYTLNWVPNEVNKISYATSFGISSIPDKYKAQYKKFLSRIENLSVRENNAVKLVKDVSERDATLVCDPTLLLTKEEWMDVQQEEPILNEKYIFCYFLGDNIEHRRFVERLKEKTSYKIVSINHCDEYVKYSDQFADIIPYDVGPSEFINYIRNAEYVCTDSFHGTVFSLINNTNFFTFERFNKKSKMSTNSRVHSLLEIVELKDRLISGKENVEKLINEKIDFKKVNLKLEKFRDESKEWLLKAIKWKNDNIKHIVIEEKSDCCGCTACMNTCPKGAIEMIEDDEGFKYPYINKDKCIDCGLCKKVCPILNNKKEVKYKQDGYVINNKNNKIRKESTSGGAFSAIAEYVISTGGYVFGAAFEKDYTVTHQCVDNKKELAKFRNSKYVQSSPKDTFKRVKELLKDNKLVCYSGTPCQIEGLRSYLQKDYENLIIVDVVCRSVPSPKLLRIYLDYIRKNKLDNEEIEKVIFRDKSKYGYKYTLMTVKSKNYIYQEGIDTDPYLRAFFSGLSIRPSCENCKFKKQYRKSDFTMWDCFNVEKFNRNMDDNIGTTRLLVQSEKGKRIFKKIKNNIDYKKIDSDILIRDSKELVKTTHNNSERTKFFEDLNKLSYEEINKKYFPNSFKVKLERFSRRRLVNLKSYKAIKKIAKKILGR